MGKTSKPWFGKRWTKNAIEWLDALIFGGSSDIEMATMSGSFCQNFTLGMICGIVYGIMTFFIDQRDLTEMLPTVGLGVTLIASGIFLYGTLRYFNSIGSKIFRALYVIVLNAIGCAMGFIVGVWAILLAVVAGIIWILLKMVFGDSDSSSKSRRVVLEDGTELRSSGRGITGEQFYTGDDGHTYTDNGSGTFRRH